jgi:hypothetical protein
LRRRFKANRFSAARADQRQLGIPFEALGKAFYVNVYAGLALEVANVMARNVFATSFDPHLIDPVLDIGAKYNLTSRPVHSPELAFPV